MRSGYLESLQKVATFADPIEPEDTDHPALSGARLIQYNAQGHIFIDHNEHWQIFDRNGRPKLDIFFCWVLASRETWFLVQPPTPLRPRNPLHGPAS